jgi:hypothetical protein
MAMRIKVLSTCLRLFLILKSSEIHVVQAILVVL